MEREPQFEIGHKFVRTRGVKHPRIETIEDILTTRTSSGEVVKIEYKCSHLFMGSKLYVNHIGTTIAMSELPKIIKTENE